MLITVKPLAPDADAVIWFAVLSKYTLTASPALKPEPVTAIVVVAPRVPDVGVMLAEGDDTLNAIVAVLDPSVSDSVYAPGI